jgi:hypothetical protein
MAADNCPRCRAHNGLSAHRIEQCPCLPAGAWCHGVRAATLDPARIERWWTANPRVAVGVAAGPSGLLLVDIDTHADSPPDKPATELLPGIDLAAELRAHRLRRLRGGRHAAGRQTDRGRSRRVRRNRAPRPRTAR